MEKQIFTWQQWDDIAEGVYQYYIIELVRRVGCFGEGECFERAVMDYSSEEPSMTLHRNGLEWKFPLSLTVGDMVRGPDNS